MRFVLGLVLFLTVMAVGVNLSAAQTQTGSVGFLEPSITSIESDTVIIPLHLKNIDQSYGNLVLKIRVSASKTVAGFTLWYAGKCVLVRDTYKATSFELNLNLNLPAQLELKPIESHLPFNNVKKINLKITSVKQPSVTANRRPAIGRSGFTLRLINDYPYLPTPLIQLVPNTQMMDSSVIQVLSQAVLANGFTDTDSLLSVRLADSQIFSSYGARVTEDTARNLIFYDPSTLKISPEFLSLGILDSFWCALSQKGAGISKIQLYVVVGPKYAPGVKFNVPFGWIDAQRTAKVDTSLKYPTGTVFLSYVMQSVKPDYDPWFSPYDRGRDNQLYILGEDTEFNFTYRYPVRKLKGGIGHTSAELEPRAQMRLYGSDKVRKMRKEGGFFLDAGISDPAIQLPAAGMMITCHIPKYGKKKGKRISYAGVVMLIAPPTVDTVIQCVRDDTGDSVLYIVGSTFSKSPAVQIEYQKLGKVPVSTLTLTKLYATKRTPITLTALDGRKFSVPEKTEPGIGGIVVAKYPKKIPAANNNPATGTPRYDLLIRSKLAIGGLPNIVW